MSDDIAIVNDEPTELVTLESLQARKQVSTIDEDEFDKMQAGKFLPRIQLMTGRSGKVEKGEFPVNHYALVSGSHFTDLGKEADVLVLAMRPKALEIGDDIISIYNKDDAEFIRIKDRADTEKDSGCMWGFEFLVWSGRVRKFASFFCGSKTARKESPNLMSHMNGAATLRSHYIETAKFSWQGLKVGPCSTPMPMPTVANMDEQVEKFINPPAPNQVVNEADNGRAV